MKKLDQKELLGRAKKLYFDKNKNIKTIFVDEYGRFSYQKQPLLEVNGGTKTAIFQIEKDAVKSVDVQGINDFGNKEKVEETFSKPKNKK